MALRETALALSIRHDLAAAHHSHSHGHNFGSNFAQVNNQTKSKINELKGEIKSAKQHLFEAQSARSELKEQVDCLESGQHDYEETLNIIQERLEGYQGDLEDVNSRVANRDKLIASYRKQIQKAEAQIKDLEAGKTVKIQVPVVRQTKVIRQQVAKAPPKKKAAGPQVIYKKAGQKKPAQVVKAAPSGGKNEAAENSQAQTYVENESDLESEVDSDIDAYSYLSADSDLEADSDIEKTYEIVESDGGADSGAEEEVIRLVKAPAKKESVRVIRQDDKPTSHNQSATIIKSADGKEKYRIMESLPNKAITKVVEVKPRKEAPKERIEHIVESPNKVERFTEIQGGEEDPVKHTVTHTPKGKGEPDHVHHVIEVSPEAKEKAEEAVVKVFNIDHNNGGKDGKNGGKAEKTAEELREQHARSPVDSIQQVVKQKQEEARAILKKKEQEAKEMIDQIVEDRKKFDQEQEEKQAKALANRPRGAANAAADKPGPKNSRELRNQVQSLPGTAENNRVTNLNSINPGSSKPGAAAPKEDNNNANQAQVWRE